PTSNTPASHACGPCSPSPSLPWHGACALPRKSTAMTGGDSVPTTGFELLVQIVGGIFGGGTLLKILDWTSGRLAERAKERREDVNDTVTRLRTEIVDLEKDRDTCRA